MTKQDKATLAQAQADILAAEEAEADAYGEAQVAEAQTYAAAECLPEPERFASGGATAEEIAAWRAEHAK